MGSEEILVSLMTQVSICIDPTPMLDDLPHLTQCEDNVKQVLDCVV